MLPKLIDNDRKSLKEVLIRLAQSGDYKHLSIATGYWDLPGMEDLLEALEGFESIRLLIGQEPLPDRLQEKLKLDPDNPEALFPDKDFSHDLERLDKGDLKSAALKARVAALRESATRLANYMNSGMMEVKIFRQPRLHAKAYIFGDLNSQAAVGIVGSSNFTKAGLTRNAELNYLEQDPRMVLFEPKNELQENGHLSWFNTLWNDEEALPWTGEFTKIVQNSPVGDMTYGPYDVYIKTLMEVFPDELIAPEQLSENTSDVLYSFQDRNAGILLNKLSRMGVAMLADSVGLGKTITSGAVIKHYREMGAHRILVIAPAALKQQWRDDLGEHFGLDETDFGIVSMQDIGEHKHLVEEMQKPWVRNVDLFVIDEAHNLRSPSSSRYNSILTLLETSPAAPVLLLTATPINNSLMDFANQIRLGLRGHMKSVPVQYTNSNGEVRTIDFIDALLNIQRAVQTAEHEGDAFDWSRHQGTLRAGLRHFLVRSTRQGVELEGGLVKGGQQRHFPKTSVQQATYAYSPQTTQLVYNSIKSEQDALFEGIDSLCLNLDAADMLTQQAIHPLDFFAGGNSEQQKRYVEETKLELDTYEFFMPKPANSLIVSIYQVINLLGFVPYKTEVYRHKYYARTQEQIRALGLGGKESSRILNQRGVHNILHVTWLKRLESSVASLYESVLNYAKNLESFSSYLERGYLISLSDLEDVESTYGDDLQRAFSDYEESMKAIEKAIQAGKDPSTIKVQGVECRRATERDYLLEQMKCDLDRDRRILAFLQALLEQVRLPEHNAKLQTFAEELKRQLQNGTHGKKVLVFSFFADTINYLQNTLPALMKDVEDFEQRSAYLCGGSSNNVKETVRRFAPEAKKYELKPGEQEIDFLFATDVLSEGQNLQDAGLLVNFDLHWNPVRMIQRNGRINRLGSPYEDVLVINMQPHDDLEAYLKLVRRLERKIDTIINSVGTDQSILGEKENPIEFLDFYSSDAAKASAAAQAAEQSSSFLDNFDSSDEYAFELRQFIGEHGTTSEEFKRVANIPLGKWNYLPQQHEAAASKGVLKAGDYLALERVVGRSSVTEKPFTTTLFMKIDSTDRWLRTDSVEDVDALALIKTDPSNNEPLPDNIDKTLDRLAVANRAENSAKVKTETNEATYFIKPAGERALKVLQALQPAEVDLQNYIRHIVYAQDKQAWETIVRRVNEATKRGGSIPASVQLDFEKLIGRLDARTHEVRKAQQISSVLFYAQN